MEERRITRPCLHMITGNVLVVDMQVDFVNGAHGTAEAQAIVDGVAKAIDGWDGTIRRLCAPRGGAYTYC